MFLPTSSSNSQSTNWNQVNNMIRELNKEQQTKVFKGPNNINALISGRLPNDLGYGIQFSDSNNIPRIIAYIDSNNQPIFKISESGIDVTSAANDELIFNSQQNVFKIVGTGTGTFPSASASTGAGGGWQADQQTTEITHNLGFVPIVIAHINFGGGWSLTPFSFFNVNASGIDLEQYYVYATSTSFFAATNVAINRTGAGSATIGGQNFTYYLLQETAN